MDRIKPASQEGTTRLVRSTIQYALDNGRDSVSLVHKDKIMEFTESANLVKCSVFGTRIVENWKSRYPLSAAYVEQLFEHIRCSNIRIVSKSREFSDQNRTVLFIFRHPTMRSTHQSRIERNDVI